MNSMKNFNISSVLKGKVRNPKIPKKKSYKKLINKFI